AVAESDLETRILPSFRPDKVFKLAGGEEFRSYIGRLEKAAGQAITDISSLFIALQRRVDYFHDRGCRISDHGLAFIPYSSAGQAKLDDVFKQVIAGDDANAGAYEGSFTFLVLTELCRMYHARGWVQQFHLGPLRNNNTRK